MDIAAQKGIAVADLTELIQQADYITVHIPKNEETQNLISDKEFSLMKKTVRVINCARGGIINERRWPGRWSKIASPAARWMFMTRNPFRRIPRY